MWKDAGEKSEKRTHFPNHVSTQGLKRATRNFINPGQSLFKHLCVRKILPTFHKSSPGPLLGMLVHNTCIHYDFIMIFSDPWRLSWRHHVGEFGALLSTRWVVPFVQVLQQFKKTGLSGSFVGFVSGCCGTFTIGSIRGCIVAHELTMMYRIDYYCFMILHG